MLKLSNIISILKNFKIFLGDTFIKKTKYPIVAILLFILALVLNIIQYVKGSTFLQEKIIGNMGVNRNPTNFKNIFLFLFDILGMNGFIFNTIPVHIFVLIISYVLFGLIELNIGHIALLFVLCILIFFNSFTDNFNQMVCNNIIYPSNNYYDGLYCCGSFIMCFSIAFVLYLMQNNTKNLKLRLLTIFLMCIVGGGLILYDFYNSGMIKSDTTICYIFTWHFMNYMFGIFSGSVLGNFLP